MGKVESITGLSFPCLTSSRIRMRSALLPIVEPRIERFLKKTAFRSIWNITARRGAARDDSPAPGKEFHAVAPRIRADVVDDDFTAPFPHRGEHFLDAFPHGLGAVIHDVIRAELGFSSPFRRN